MAILTALRRSAPWVLVLAVLTAVIDPMRALCRTVPSDVEFDSKRGTETQAPLRRSGRVLRSNLTTVLVPTVKRPLPPQLLASTQRAVAIGGTEISPSLPDHQCIHEKTNASEVLRSVASAVALPDDVNIRSVWRCRHCGYVDRLSLVNARHVHPAIVRRIETWLADQER